MGRPNKGGGSVGYPKPTTSTKSTKLTTKK